MKVFLAQASGQSKAVKLLGCVPYFTVVTYHSQHSVFCFFHMSVSRLKNEIVGMLPALPCKVVQAYVKYKQYDRMEN
jgi:hypothetical protein